MSWEGSDALIWSPERLRTATDAAGVALWSWNVDTNEISFDDRAHAMWGVPRQGPFTTETLSERIDLADQERVRTTLDATRRNPGPYEIDFRILRGAEVRWITARGLGADEGMVDRIMFGIFLDVTARKLAEETREMIAGEMTHRVKNLFAIVSSLTSIAARSAETTADMARDLMLRLGALSGAQDLIRPDADRRSRPSAPIAELFKVFLAPYENGLIGKRIHLSLPDLGVGEASATMLALIVHELATNSVKYGALSTAGGSLEVTGLDDGKQVTIVWTERGGPPVSAPSGPDGFGSKLILRSVAGPLGGTIAQDWRPGGVVITLRLDRARLTSP